MPRLNGLELLQELRQSYLHLPIIVVSADDRSSAISQAMSYGATSFLRKPFDSGLLLRAIRQLTSSSPADGPSPFALQ